MERLDVTFYILTVAMIALPVTICEIFAIEMCMTLISTFRVGQCQI